MNLGHLVVRFYFLNSGNLICRSTDISMYFRESLGVRDNVSRLYSKCLFQNMNEFSTLNARFVYLIQMNDLKV